MSQYFIHEHAPMIVYFDVEEVRSPSSEPDNIRTSIIDTATGRPAANVRVTLCCTALPSIWFVVHTDDHGTIENWKNTQCEGVSDGIYVSQHGGVTRTIRHILDTYSDQDEGMRRGISVWKLEFDTGAYSGEMAGMEKVAVEVVVHKDVRVDIQLHVGLHGFNVIREIDS